MMNENIRKQIEKLADNLARTSLKKEEMTYFEILSQKTNTSMHKVKKTIGKLKRNSKNYNDSKEELSSYLQDYVEDLLQAGYSEVDALEKAKVAFEVQNPDNPLLTDEKYQDWQEYHESLSPAIQEAIGLAYGSCTLIGMVLGTILGIFAQILYNGYFYGWLLVILIVLGLLLGVSVGMAKHAKLIKENQ